MADIKNYLYTWCCKRGSVLSYEYSNVGLKSPHFICQATISTIDYVAQGGASSKKEAQTLAAKNFVKYLMDHNFMLKINESPHPSNPTTIKQPNKIANGRTENTADQGITQQKLKEFDAIDQSASLHGNWKLENAKSRLHHFLQINRLSSEYRYKVIGTTPQTKAYIAEMSFHVNKDDNPIMISASEYGKTKIAASKACALMLLRQLFHMGLVESYDPTQKLLGTTAGSKKKKFGKKRGKDGGFRDTPKRIKPETVSNWIMDPPCNVNLSPEINAKFDEALKMLQLIPLDIIPEEPSLNVKSYSQILEKIDFSIPSDINLLKPAPLLWTPPMKDWNTWTCKEILPPINLEEYNDLLLKEWNAKIDENCSEFTKILEERKNMPIYAHKDEILTAISNHAVVFVKGPPKIGKSTQIPQYILEQGIIQGRGSQNCVCVVSGHSVPPLLARELTAKVLAVRIQKEQNFQRTAVIAGFQNIWGETDIVAPNKVADNTFLSFDQGILPRPFGSALYCNMEYFLQRILRYGIKGISHLIIDEVYERDSLTEFILMLMRDCVQVYNPHFKLIILSSDTCISDIENYFVNQHMKIIDIFSKKDHSIISNVSLDGTSEDIDEVNNEKTETIDFKKTIGETLFLEDCIELTHFDYNGIVGTAYGRMRRRKKAKLRRNLPPTLHNLNYAVDPDETKAPFCDFSIVDGEELENQKRRPLKIYKPLTRYVCSQMSLKNDISFELIYSIIDYIVSSKEYGTILIFLPNVTYIQSLEKYLLDIIGRMSIEENSSNNVIESENDGNNEESKITEESMNNENVNANRKKRNFTFYKLHEWTSFTDWEKMSFNQNDDTPDKLQKIILATSIGERLTLRDDNPLYIINTCKVEKGGIYVTKSDNTTITNHKLIVLTAKSNVDLRSNLLNSSSKGGGSCFNLISRECYERLPNYTVYPTNNLPRILLIALILAQTQNAKIELQYQKLLRPDLYQLKTSLSFLLQMGAFELIGLNNLNVNTTSVDQLFANNVKVSALGRILAYLPDMGDLKMGKMIIASSIFGVSDLMTTLVSLHVNPDIFDNAMLNRKTLLRHLKTICDTNNRNSDLLAKLLIYNNQYISSLGNPNNEINIENNADSLKQSEEILWNENFCQNVHRTQIYLSFNLNSLLNLNKSTIQQSLRPENKITLKQLDILVALLNIGFNPNICYLLGPRFVLLDKSVLGIIDKHSIISTLKRSAHPNFPFFIFTEKVLSKNRYINDLSLVSPLQFLLFGTYQFCLQADTSIITINDWIRIKMDSHILAKLILLRGAFDKMINVVCQDSTLLHKLLQHSETQENIHQNLDGMEPRIAKSCIIRDVIFALTSLNAGAFDDLNNIKPLETEPSVLQDLTVQQSTPENSINNEKIVNDDKIMENKTDDVLSITSFDSEDSLYIPYQHLLKESTMMINMYRRPPPPYFYYHPNYYNPNLRYFANKNAPNNMRFYGPRIPPRFYRGPRPSFYPPPPHTEELEKAEIENEIPPSPMNHPADMKTFPTAAGFGPTVPPLRRPPFGGPPRRPVFYGRPRQQPVFNNRYGGPRGGPYPFYGPNGNYRFLGPRGPRMLPYQTNDNNSKTENTNITNINNGDNIIHDESNNISGSADVSMDNGKNLLENNEEQSLTTELDRSGMSFLDISEGNGFENSSLME